MQQLSLSLDPAPMPVALVFKRLKQAFGGFSDGPPRLAPVDQLIRSMLGSRTTDQLSWPAYHSLKDRFRPWERLAEASPEAVQKAIAQVTHAEIKAGWLPEALSRIIRLKGSLDLDFLGAMPVEEGIAWLRTHLPGVGDKVAASVLNFSTLNRRALVVDTHVWRVARRIGLAPRNAEPEAVRRILTDAVPDGFTAEDFFDLHWLLKRLGQTSCQDRTTRCGACPVAELCASRQQAKANPRRPNVVFVEGWNKR